MLEASRQLLEAGEVTVVAPRGAGRMAPQGVMAVEVSLRPLWRLLAELGWNGMHTARSWPADLVLASSGLIAPVARLSASRAACPYAVFIHGLDVVYPHPLYQGLFLPAIRAADKVIANSRYTAELALQRGVNPSRLEVIPPGVKCSFQVAEKSFIQSFRHRHGLLGRVLLSVGRLTRRKGLVEFVDQVFPQIIEENPDCVLAIVGDDPDDALGQQMARPAIEAAAKKHGIGTHIHFLGHLSDDELHLAWQSADLHVFPVKDIPGDVEGFGMVALEAAANGVWSVAFASGGVVDAIAEGESGSLVRPLDYGQFAAAVSNALSRDPQALRQKAICHAKKFDWSVYGQRIRRVCCQLCA